MLHIPTSRNGEIRITIYGTPYSTTYIQHSIQQYIRHSIRHYIQHYIRHSIQQYTYSTPYSTTYSTAIVHLPQLHYTYSSSAKNCVTCNSYTMCAGDLTDIYTRGLRACGPWASGVYISQITSTHSITNMCHLFVHILCGWVLMKLP